MELAQHSPPQIRRLSASLVSVRLSDGLVDVYHICERHAWASRGETSSALAERARCPHCELDAGGHERYRVLVSGLGAETRT